MMSDSFFYSGDNVAMMSELEHCYIAVRQHSGIGFDSKARLSAGTSMALAPECGLTFPWKCMC